jgi:hypothetical protein
MTQNYVAYAPTAIRNIASRSAGVSVDARTCIEVNCFAVVIMEPHTSRGFLH